MTPTPWGRRREAGRCVRRHGIALAGTLLAPGVIQAQGSELRGRVISVDSVPIVGATVTLISLGYAVHTDSSGAFRFAGTPGSTLTLAITAPGYRNETVAVVLARGRTVSQAFVLASIDAPPVEANRSAEVVSVRVTDVSGMPLAYANVQLNGGHRYVSDDSGRLALPVPSPGPLSLLIRRIGFELAEVKLAARPDTGLAITLQPAAVVLPETRITATSPFRSLDLHGFYGRMADTEKGARRGWYWTPEELELWKPSSVTSAVEKFPGIQIRKGQFPPGERVPGIWAMRVETMQGCRMTVYVDRVRVSPIRVRGTLYDESINSLITPTTLSGIEVYPTTLNAPPEFPPVPETCGVVLLWTK